MNFASMLGGVGESIDRDLVAWRQSGVRGDDEARERFHKEQFHGARAVMRIAVEIKVFQDSSLSRTQALEAIKDGFINQAEEQATESGFDEQERAFYVGITREAIASLAEHYQLEP